MKRKYGPLLVEMRHLRRSGPDEVFRVTVTDEEGHWHISDIHVPWDPDDEPVLDRIAAWRAIDELRGASKEPEEFIESAAKGFTGGEKGDRRARTEWAESVVGTALTFDGQDLDDAWGDTLVEAERVGKRPWERGGPKEWFPGS